MPMIDYSGQIEFMCECQKCGKTLRADMTTDYKGKPICQVESCQDCVDEAVDKAKE